jgi:hypothetical protein
MTRQYLLCDDEDACERRSWLMEYETWCDYLDTFPRGRCGASFSPRRAAFDEAIEASRERCRADNTTMHPLCYAYTGDKPWFLRARIAP